MSIDARDKIRQTIQNAYQEKTSANKALREVYSIVEDDDEWEDYEDYDEDEEDEEDDDSDGGILGAVLDILPDDESED